MSRPSNPQPDPLLRAALPWLGPCAVCIGAALLIFLVPLAVPVRFQPTISASYIAGYNNTVGILLTAAISFLVFLVSAWQPRIPRTIPHSPKLSLRSPFVLVTVTVTAAVLSVLSLVVLASHISYLRDAGYLIEAVTVRLDTGRALYRQMEFAYGPLLLLPEVWTAQALHLTPAVAYFLVFVLESVAGLLLLVWIMNQLPIEPRLRGAALILFAIGTVTPHLGLNYTFVRFGAPPAILLWGIARRSPWYAALALAAGQVVVLLLSPELAFALSLAVVAVAIARTLQSGPVWLVTAACPLLALGASLALMGRPYLEMIGQFSHGTLNLPIGPYPHILVFLVAAVWLVPRLFRGVVSVRSPDAAPSLALYIFGLALLPAALGRCDPIHVLFDGIALLILSLVAVSAHSRRAQTAWLCALALLVFWSQYVNNRLFIARTANVLRLGALRQLPERTQDQVVELVRHVAPRLAVALNLHKYPPGPPFDLPALTAITHAGPVATPFAIDPVLEAQLRSAHLVAPGFFESWVDVLSPAAEQHAIADMNAAPWALLPIAPDMYEPETPATLTNFHGMALPYHVRNPIPYLPGALFRRNLQEHWARAQSFGYYQLYRNRSLAPASAPPPM